MFECPACGGRGCPACEDRGTWDLEVCPLEFAGPEAMEIVRWADLAGRGLWPAAGAGLDQAAAFLDACRFVWAEDEAAKARRLRLESR